MRPRSLPLCHACGRFGKRSVASKHRRLPFLPVPRQCRPTKEALTPIPQTSLRPGPLHMAIAALVQELRLGLARHVQSPRHRTTSTFLTSHPSTLGESRRVANDAQLSFSSPSRCSSCTALRSSAPTISPASLLTPPRHAIFHPCHFVPLSPIPGQELTSACSRRGPLRCRPPSATITSRAKAAEAQAR